MLIQLTNKLDFKTIENHTKFKQPLYHKEFPLILFWSPKSGCTSLVKWFFFQNGLLEKAIKYDPWIHKYRNKVYQKQMNYTGNLIRGILSAKKDTIKLVRNPYKRAISTFLHVLSYNNLIDEIGVDVNKGLSFKQYLYKIRRIGVNINSINPHIAQQYIGNEEYYIRNYIFLEEFNDAIRKIEENYKLLKSPYSEITTSFHHNTDKMTVIGEHAETVLTKQRLGSNLPTYKSFYDKETKDLVFYLYEKDFKKYGYNHIDLE